MHRPIEPTAIFSLDNYYVTGILSEQINDIWPFVAPMIERSVEYSDGKFLLEDIKDFLQKQICQLWVFYRDNIIVGALVTEIINYPRDKRLIFLFCAGVEAQGWLHLSEVIKNFARAQGCTHVEICGRPGWVKKMHKFGFRQTHVVLTAPL